LGKKKVPIPTERREVWQTFKKKEKREKKSKEGRGKEGNVR